MDVTAAVIVKNEERCIKRCIDSVLPLFTEIVVVDTGSTDSTLDIVSSYEPSQVKLFHCTWNDDFSEPRNMAISQANCKYIFFIDADEFVISDKNTVCSEIERVERICDNHTYAWSPGIRDTGDNNITCSVRRFFRKTGFFYFAGYVHEELRNKEHNPVTDQNLNIILSHDGYSPEVMCSKEKKERNRRLNIKNTLLEPNNLRWTYFLYRDNFEDFAAEDICCNLSRILKKNPGEDLSLNNIIFCDYTFPLVDLMVMAKLELMDDEAGFNTLLSVMNCLIPHNSNAVYYEVVFYLLKWKIFANKTMTRLIRLRKENKLLHDDMLHSEGMHIDAALAFYLHEAGFSEQGERLLTSVRKSGFITPLTEKYICS